MARLLLIEDDEHLRFSMRQALRRASHDVSEADSLQSARATLRDREFDAVLTDLSLPDGDGTELIESLRSDDFQGPVVVITGDKTVESAVRAMKLGADDYLLKPVGYEELTLQVERLLAARRDQRRLRLLERIQESREASGATLGESDAWNAVLKLADRLAAMPLPSETTGPTAALPTVLILGETGAGKGVVARRIHETAARLADQQPAPAFVHVNCTALPPTLIESELFGHERGAFTDATSSREGLFEMASGGTIFLDEIGDMPIELQAKLLTVIEEGTFRRLGGARTLRVCARVLAATNQDLEKKIEQGAFRSDLFYRLSAFPINLPPLRQRGEDAVLIAESLLRRFAQQYGRGGLRLDDSARSAIRRYAWPGNVRELVNIIQRAAMLAEGHIIGVGALGIGGSSTPPSHAAGSGAPVFDFEHGVHRHDDVERELIVQALHHTGGNVTRAARLIGMQRSSIRNRIERYGLDDIVEEAAST
ncbi:MAG: sigma-54-dependent transcriptional regulator [Phycisphaerales bacterium JB039]